MALTAVKSHVGGLVGVQDARTGVRLSRPGPVLHARAGPPGRARQIGFGRVCILLRLPATVSHLPPHFAFLLARIIASQVLLPRAISIHGCTHTVESFPISGDSLLLDPICATKTLKIRTKIIGYGCLEEEGKGAMIVCVSDAFPMCNFFYEPPNCSWRFLTVYVAW